MILGVSMIIYPSLSFYLSERNGSQAIRSYQKDLDVLDEALVESVLAEAEVYNESLTGTPVHDPFLEGSGMSMPDDYWEVLNVGGLMGYIEIPKISVYLPIYHGTSEDTLKKGIGHLEGSTLPIGGPARHSVLTGHAALTTARLFTDLVELEEGDYFYIYVLGQVMAYQVDQIKVVEPHVTEDLLREQGKDQVTLLTCYPYGVNSHRLLVRGERVEYNPVERAAIQKVRQSSADQLVLQAAIITSMVMLALVIVVLLYQRRKRREELHGAQGRDDRQSSPNRQHRNSRFRK
jgi:sortase A